MPVPLAGAWLPWKLPHRNPGPNPRKAAGIGSHLRPRRRNSSGPRPSSQHQALRVPHIPTINNIQGRLRAKGSSSHPGSEDNNATSQQLEAAACFMCAGRNHASASLKPREILGQQLQLEESLVGQVIEAQLAQLRMCQSSLHLLPCAFWCLISLTAWQIAPWRTPSHNLLRQHLLQRRLLSLFKTLSLLKLRCTSHL